MSNSSIMRRVENPDSGIRTGNRLPLDPDGGLELADVRADAILEVQTKNTCYTVIPQAPVT